MLKLLDKRLLITMGKGGVGKSLVSALLTRLALKRDKRVLLVQINTKDKISGYLGCDSADEEIREVMPNLFSVNIRPESAMKEYVLMQVKLEFIYRLVFENPAVKYFLQAVPGLNDLVVLGKVYYHVGQKDKSSGKPVYDLIVVDAPPTGHGLFLLQLPQVMMRAVKSGPIHREARAMQAMLQDPAITSVNLVTLLEEMPVAETREMYATIADDYKLPMGRVFANMTPERPFEEGDAQCIKALSEQSEDAALAELGRHAQNALERQKLADTYEAKLRGSIDLPYTSIGRVFSERFGPDELETIVECIERTYGGDDAT